MSIDTKAPSLPATAPDASLEPPRSTSTSTSTSPEWCAAESMYVPERFVIADAWGTFVLAAGAPSAGDPISKDQVIGAIGGEPVRSRFDGIFAGWLALSSERVRPAQPLLWLRVAQ